MWDHKILSNQGVLRQWEEPPITGFVLLMFTVESPISFQIWHAQHPQSSKFSPSSGSLDKEVSQKPWALMGEGKRHHSLSCGQPKANASPSCQLFQGRVCLVLVCWNKLALLEGQKWQRCRDGKAQPQSPTTARVRRSSRVRGIWQSRRQEQWVKGNSLIAMTSGVQRQKQ